MKCYKNKLSHRKLQKDEFKTNRWFLITLSLCHIVDTLLEVIHNGINNNQVQLKMHNIRTHSQIIEECKFIGEPNQLLCLIQISHYTGIFLDSNKVIIIH